MAAKAAGRGRPDAARAIADDLLQLSGRSTREVRSHDHTPPQANGVAGDEMKRAAMAALAATVQLDPLAPLQERLP